MDGADNPRPHGCDNAHRSPSTRRASCVWLGDFRTRTSVRLVARNKLGQRAALAPQPAPRRVEPLDGANNPSRHACNMRTSKGGLLIRLVRDPTSMALSLGSTQRHMHMHTEVAREPNIKKINHQTRPTTAHQQKVEEPKRGIEKHVFTRLKAKA
jgi:hypothetical protein